MLACVPATKEGKSSVIVCVSFTHTRRPVNQFLLTKSTYEGWAMPGSSGGHRLRCMTKSRYRDNLLGAANGGLISFHYCALCCTLLSLPVFGSNYRVINGPGQTGAWKGAAQMKKGLRDRLRGGVRSNRLKWLSAHRYQRVSPLHKWRRRVLVMATHSDCLSLRLSQATTLKILKVQRMWTTCLNESYSRLFGPHSKERVSIVVIIQLKLDFKGAFKGGNLMKIVKSS